MCVCLCGFFNVCVCVCVSFVIGGIVFCNVCLCMCGLRNV